MNDYVVCKNKRDLSPGRTIRVAELCDYKDYTLLLVLLMS